MDFFKIKIDLFLINDTPKTKCRNFQTQDHQLAIYRKQETVTAIFTKKYTNDQIPKSVIMT